MVKIPSNPEEIYKNFINDTKSVFSNDLISVLITGSAAKGEYIRKKSDINFIIVLTEEGMKKIPDFLRISKRWAKANVSVPLFLYKEYIKSSLDSFPIEFLNIKNNSRIIFGDDITNIIEIDKNDLRLQVEREIKGKLLQLRQVFFEINKNPKSFQQFISVSISTFNPIFSAAVYLKKDIYPRNREEIFTEISEIFSIDKDFFERLLDIKKGDLKVSKDTITTIWENYVENIRKISKAIDNHII